MVSGQTCPVALAHEKLGRTLAEPSIITPEEYLNIFSSLDEENGNVDAKGSDIDIQEVDSDKEVEEDVQESDNEDNAADAIGGETAWSNKLTNFVISQYNSQPAIKVEVP